MRKRNLGMGLLVLLFVFSNISYLSAEVDFGVGVDYLVPADHRLEQGVGYSFYMKFGFNEYLSYGIMFCQNSLTGEEDGATVVLERSEYLFSLWYELTKFLYLRVGAGGGRIIVSSGSGINDTKILSEFGLGYQKVNKGKITSKLYVEVGYKLQSANQDYFDSGNLVTNLGGVSFRVGASVGF